MGNIFIFFAYRCTTTLCTASMFVDYVPGPTYPRTQWLSCLALHVLFRLNAYVKRCMKLQHPAIISNALKSRTWYNQCRSQKGEIHLLNFLEIIEINPSLNQGLLTWVPWGFADYFHRPSEDNVKTAAIRYITNYTLSIGIGYVLISNLCSYLVTRPWITTVRDYWPFFSHQWIKFRDWATHNLTLFVEFNKSFRTRS